MANNSNVDGYWRISTTTTTSTAVRTTATTKAAAAITTTKARNSNNSSNSSLDSVKKVIFCNQNTYWILAELLLLILAFWILRHFHVNGKIMKITFFESFLFAFSPPHFVYFPLYFFCSFNAHQTTAFLFFFYFLVKMEGRSKMIKLTLHK